MIDKFTLSGGYWRHRVAWFKTFQIIWSLLCSQQNSYQFWGSEIIPGCITSCQNFANLVKISLFHSWHVILFWVKKKISKCRNSGMFLDVQDTCVIAFEYKLVCYSTYPGNLQFLLNYFRIAFSLSYFPCLLQTKKWLLRRNRNLYHISFNESCFTFGLIWINYYKVLHWLFSHS